MNYSELKPIIRTLHLHGWKKEKGIPLYMKTWRRQVKQLHQYRQTLTVNEVIQAREDLDTILEWYDRKADHAFAERLGYGINHPSYINKKGITERGI